MESLKIAFSYSIYYDLNSYFSLYFLAFEDMKK